MRWEGTPPLAPVVEAGRSRGGGDAVSQTDDERRAGRRVRREDERVGGREGEGEGAPGDGGGDGHRDRRGSGRGGARQARVRVGSGAGSGDLSFDNMKIALAGEGGQGVQLVGEVLALAGFLSGLHALYIPNFGVEQRGGVSLAYVQLGRYPIGSPKFRHADVLVALSARSIERTRPLVGPGTLLMYDSSSVRPPIVEDDAIGIHGWDTIAPEAFASMTGTGPREAGGGHGGEHVAAGAAPFVVGLPAADIARSEFIPRAFNVIVMGAVVEATGMVTMDKVKEALDLKLGHKFKDDPGLRDLNHRALERGAGLIRSERQREAAGLHVREAVPGRTSVSPPDGGGSG
ncbi:MAG: 2-oxoacid:acceptor oxidoreductase family protein [Clostridia bacterium]